jgi:large subunit ribosomal protein L40e
VIFLKIIGGRTVVLHDVQPSETVYDLKCKIQATEGTPPGKQRLFYRRKELGDKDMLWNYDIQNESTIDLVFRIQGNRFKWWYLT